jgi:hypothetical protein
MCSFPQNALIGQTSTMIIETNYGRSGFFVRNLSAGNVSIGFSHPAEVNKGIVLRPGEAYSMGRNDFSVGDINLIATQADCLVAFQEFAARGNANW